MTRTRYRSPLERPLPWVAAIVFISLAAWQVLRVNAPPSETTENGSFRATTGDVLNGRYAVTAGDFLAVRMDFNHRVKLTGQFKTPRYEGLIGCMVVDAANFENWKNGGEFDPLARTGPVPGGRINLVLEAGTYYLVLENRRSTADQPVEAFFSVE